MHSIFTVTLDEGALPLSCCAWGEIGEVAAARRSPVSADVWVVLAALLCSCSPSSTSCLMSRVDVAGSASVCWLLVGMPLAPLACALGASTYGDKGASSVFPFNRPMLPKAVVILILAAVRSPSLACRQLEARDHAGDGCSSASISPVAATGQEGLTSVESDGHSRKPTQRLSLDDQMETVQAA